jgi:hypothetical protein
LSDGFDKGVKRSRSSLAKSCFELRESLFDWIEVGAISWQVAKGRASLRDCFLNAGDFVTGERSTPDAPGGGELSMRTISPLRKVGARKCAT